MVVVVSGAIVVDVRVGDVGPVDVGKMLVLKLFRCCCRSTTRKCWLVVPLFFAKLLGVLVDGIF